LSEEAAKEWPVGCRNPTSCARNRECMYLNCPHDGRDIAKAKAFRRHDEDVAELEAKK
jgi:hypothetical protein